MARQKRGRGRASTALILLIISGLVTQLSRPLFAEIYHDYQKSPETLTAVLTFHDPRSLVFWLAIVVGSTIQTMFWATILSRR